MFIRVLKVELFAGISNFQQARPCCLRPSRVGSHKRTDRGRTQWTECGKGIDICLLYDIWIYILSSFLYMMVHFVERGMAIVFD